MEYDFRKMGDRIVNARKKERKWSQDRFIEELNSRGVAIGRNRLSKIENGEQQYFDLGFMLAVCDIFGWDMGYLLGEYGETTRDKYFICEYTGLSEKALDPLCKHSAIISKIITQRQFSELAYKLSELTDFEAINRVEARNIKEHISTKLRGEKSVLGHTEDALKFSIDSLFRRIVDNIEEEAAQNGKT